VHALAPDEHELVGTPAGASDRPDLVDRALPFCVVAGGGEHEGELSQHRFEEIGVPDAARRGGGLARERDRARGCLAEVERLGELREQTRAKARRLRADEAKCLLEERHAFLVDAASLVAPLHAEGSARE
jgi:hypothetical protein